MTAGPAFTKTDEICAGIQSWLEIVWLETMGSQKIDRCRRAAARRWMPDHRPPRPTSSWKDSATGKVSGLTKPVVSP